MYSFTKPKKKPLFKEDTKLWLMFISVSTTLYILFAAFLFIKTYFFQSDIDKFNKDIKKLEAQIKEIKKEKEFINIQKDFYSNILVNNSLKRDSIKNLLDLIPDPITLTKIYFDKNKLIIYGITPTKDIYNLLMLPPLESIFTTTKTYFYQMPNGWYRFKSENILKDEQ